MGTAARRAQKQADKRAALSAAPDKLASRKELKRMADLWLKREPNPGTFYNAGNARSAKAGVSMAKGSRTARSHLVTSF